MKAYVPCHHQTVLSWLPSLSGITDHSNVPSVDRRERSAGKAVGELGPAPVQPLLLPAFGHTGPRRLPACLLSFPLGLVQHCSWPGSLPQLPFLCTWPVPYCCFRISWAILPLSSPDPNPEQATPLWIPPVPSPTSYNRVLH